MAEEQEVIESVKVKEEVKKPAKKGKEEVVEVSRVKTSGVKTSGPK